jgi:hypothetical protein
VIDTEARPKGAGASAIEGFVLGYLAEKVPNLPKDALALTSYDHDSGLLSIERIASPELNIWAARLSEPDSTVPGRSWSLEFTVGELNKRIMLGSRLSCFSRNLDFDYDPGVPRVYKDLVAMGIIFGDGIKLSRSATDVRSQEEVDWLIALVANPNRSRSVIVLSSDERGVCSLNPNIFSDRLCAVAHVVRIFPDASFMLSDAVGKYLSVFDLGIRIYRPTKDFYSDDPLLHTLYTRHNLARLDANKIQNNIALDAFRTSVERTIKSQPNPTFVQVRSANAGLRLAQIQSRANITSEVVSLQEQLKAAQEARVASEAQAKESLDMAVQEEVRRKELETERDQERARGMVLAARLRSLEDRLGAAAIGKSAQRPTAYDEIPEWIEREFASRMKLHSRALRGLKEAVFENIGLVCDMLGLLAIEYVDSKRGNRDAWKRFEDATQSAGVEYSKSISDSRAGEMGDEYFVRYRGQKEFLEWHLKRGSSRDPKRDLRIYFSWDDEDQEVVIGYMPGHLDNRLT